MCCWPVPWLTLCFGNDWPVWELPASAASTSHSSTHVYLPSRIMQMTWGWKRRKTRLTMELIIYATFLVLSLIAYAARQVANKGEEKKVSVSNINFKRYLIPWRKKLLVPISSFQKSFFLVYFLALLGDWLQGPYVYKLYAFYGFKESQIAVLYVAGFASSVIFGTCTGPIADIWGRRKMVRRTFL